MYDMVTQCGVREEGEASIPPLRLTLCCSLLLLSLSLTLPLCFTLILPGVTLRVYKPVTGDGDIFLPTKPLGSKEVSRV